MIQAIIFDAGGVLVKCDEQIKEFIRIIRPKDKVQFRRNLDLFSTPLCRCEITQKEYLRRIAKSEGIDYEEIPKDLLIKNYEKLTRVNKQVLNLIKKLKRKFKIILISDTIAPHAKINKRRGLFDIFDDVILSNEVKLTKDSEKIFQLALKKNKLKPQECIFIDDVQEFVNNAKGLGIKAICFRDFAKLKRDLANFGII